jgi:CheY-like chemotaxis protein
MTGSSSTYTILLVEDDGFKEEPLSAAIRAAKPNCLLDVGRTVQQAVELVRGQCYDLIILDMSLPSHEIRPGGAQPISQPSGGLEVLLELSYDQRSDKVVIVTQYPEIEFEGRMYALAAFPKAVRRLLDVNLAAVISFSLRNDQWRNRFMEVVR